MSGASGARRWGWNRLRREWAQRIVDAACVAPGELVVDLGAGTGALTDPLVRAGARVLAVELHPGRAAALRSRFEACDVTVVQADALDARLPSRPFRVVANPPYAISSPLLRRLLARGSSMRSADLVLQRAVVNRYVSGSGHGGQRWRQVYDAQLGLRLPRRAFTPVPIVDSAVLRLRRR
ncbi:MAG: rRNA adenine N(6)-methyltransferase family protein [Actinomycetota bacterium]|nr:rRNA adenine N(6)-methyltransferase family protein [Actinomycetota bacterium]